jgi:hypothetical protein
MKILNEGQIRTGLYELSSLTEVPIADLKEEYETTVQTISGKNNNAIFLGDDKEQNMQLQTLALERLFKEYRKIRQWTKFVSKEATAEPKEGEDEEEIEEAEVEDEE